MDKMRKCPFCGGQVQRIQIKHVHLDGPEDKPTKCYTVECANEECIASNPSWYRMSREEAVKAWNNRGYSDNELFETVEAYQIEIVPGYLAKLTKLERELEHIKALPSCGSCGKRNFCRYAPQIGGSARYNCPLWSGTESK